VAADRMQRQARLKGESMRIAFFASLSVLVGLLHGAGMSEQPAAEGKTWFDFQGTFDRFAPDPESENQGLGVRVEYDDRTGARPLLRLDCDGFKDRVVTASLQVPDELLPQLKGRRLVLRMRAKWLRGRAELRTRMRCFGTEGHLIAGTNSVFEGKSNVWQPWECYCVIPPLDKVRHVDFLLALDNTPDPAAVLIDSCVLEEDRASTKAGPFASDFVAARAKAEEAPLVLVQNGQSLATIVTADDPTEAVEFAVRELNEHMELCTGVRLPVRRDSSRPPGPTIHVGKTALTRCLGLSPEFFAPDHWAVWRTGESLILSGGDTQYNHQPVSGAHVPFGTLYATYEFLERVLGVRWYWPGELGRVAPERKTLSLDHLRLQGAPSYETRYCFYPIHDDPLFSMEEIHTWWRRMRWGGIGGSAIANHSFNEWAARYGDQRPELFALQRDGSRLHDHRLGHLCFTNPDVLELTIAEKRAEFNESPWRRFRAVMPGDSLGLYYCQCEACQALVQPEMGRSGMYSHIVWDFVNRVAAATRKTHPSHFITCCAYAQYATPPEDVHLQPNVAVTLCTGQFFPNMIWRCDTKARYLQWLSRWAEKADRLNVWDYWNAPRFQPRVYGAPSIFPHAVQEWFLLDRGRVRGRVIELTQKDAHGTDVRTKGKGTNWANWMFDSLNVYVAMRLLWDLDQDVDIMLERFYRGFYGPGAPAIRRFYEEMETAYLDPNTKGGPVFRWEWSTCWMDTYPPEFVTRVMGHLRRAEELTRGHEPYHARSVKTLEGFLPFEQVSRAYGNRQAQ